jgi:hypothetical protein
MPWRACSRTASKKTESARQSGTAPLADLLRGSALATVLLLLATSLSARELTVDVSAAAGRGGIAPRIEGAPVDDIEASLADGMHAELDLILRVFEPVDGLAGLLGDRLLEEQRLELVAGYDPFAKGYRVERRLIAVPRGDGDGGGDNGDRSSRVINGGSRLVTRVADAVAALLSPGAVALPEALRGADARERYLVVQARLRPLRLYPRLRVVSLVLAGYTLRSRWTHVELAGVSR